MQNMSGGKTALGLDTNVGALICYLGNLVCALGLIYSIIVLVTDKTNKLTRFHAWQSILLFVMPLVLVILLVIFAFVGVFIDAMLGLPIFSLISILLYLLLLLFGLAALVGMIISAIKAINGEIFKLPIIGGIADRFSN